MDTRNVSRAIFTICSCNYLGQALTLMESLRVHEPQSKHYIILVDRKSGAVDPTQVAATLIWAEELGIVDFEFAAFKYNVLELNTNVKPTALRRLLERHDAVVYLDPDIHLYQPLTAVWSALEHASVALTPHMLSPVFDEDRPSERDLMRFGTFNLGFVGVRGDEEGLRMLKWWEQRCLSIGFHAPDEGLFVDQKFMDLIPSYVANFKVLRHRGLNVAYWNLHERSVRFIDGRWRAGDDDLVFVHFSGFIYRPMGAEVDAISKYPSRISLAKMPELNSLMDDYRQALHRNKFEYFISLPYSFDAFDDGVQIPRLARRVAATAFGAKAPSDPFSAKGPLRITLAKAGLLFPTKQFGQRGKAGARSMQTGASDGQKRLVRSVFRLVLKLVGVQRYDYILKIFSKLGSDLQHRFLVDDMIGKKIPLGSTDDS